MFLNPLITLAAFAKLAAIAPEDTEDTGKMARERVSALRHFFAAVELLLADGKPAINLSPQESQERKRFCVAVGNVVRLDGAYGYTNNFKAEIRRAPDYKTGNNFLTTVLKTDKAYPGRPAPLLQVKNYNLSLHSVWSDNIYSFGEFNAYRVSLVIWLARFEVFEDADGVSSSALALKIQAAFVKRYGDIADTFLKSSDEIKNLLDDCAVLPLLTAAQADYYSLLDNKPPAKASNSIGENIIFYGAPGTGKSYQLKKYEPAIRTVFHRDYQNTDFVGSYRPYVDNGKITYAFVPGPFIRSIINAINNPDQHHYLIIEEINRADAGSVFGEAFQLLDRDVSGRSEYEIDTEPALHNFLESEFATAGWQNKLYIPSNLSIFATMNSADQGVQPMDSAFKRRWKFEYLPIQFDKVAAADVRREKRIPYAGNTYSWCDFAESINRVLIRSGVNEDRLLGPFFLSNSDFSSGAMYNTISNKVFIYLWDDVLRHGSRNIVFDDEKYPSFNHINFAYQDDEAVFSAEINLDLQRAAAIEE